MSSTISCDFLGDYVQYPFNNRHINDGVKDIVNCLFSIFHLPANYVESEIEERIELCNKAMNDLVDETRARNIKSEINYLAELKALA